MHCLGSGGIRQTWQNLVETVDCGRIWQRRQIAANCGGTCGRLWWRQVESRWRVCKVSRRCPVTDKELVDQKLPYWYKEFKDIFSKVISNTLPPYWLYNHKIKIKLNKENTFGFNPLC